MRWISPFCTGVAPLSGCTFNLRFYEKWFFDVYSSADLYFDTILMMLLSEKAPIKWISESTIILLREHVARLTSIATEHDERVFVNTAETFFHRHWRIYPILQFYLNSRNIRHSSPPFLVKVINYFGYCSSLFICFLLWPKRVPRLLLRKLQTLLN